MIWLCPIYKSPQVSLKRKLFWEQRQAADLGIYSMIWDMTSLTTGKSARERGVLATRAELCGCRSLHEPYGNMDDWQEMLDTCHKYGLKLIHDLVVNHCSSEVRHLSAVI